MIAGQLSAAGLSGGARLDQRSENRFIAGSGMVEEYASAGPRLAVAPGNAGEAARAAVRMPTTAAVGARIALGRETHDGVALGVGSAIRKSEDDGADAIDLEGELPNRMAQFKSLGVCANDPLALHRPKFRWSPVPTPSAPGSR